MVLSANSVEHALVMLGCYTAGVPIAPISPAYSLISTDHAKLKHCFATVRPKVVFAQYGEMFARAFETLKAMDPDLVFVTVDGGNGTTRAVGADATEPTAAVEAARETLDHTTRGQVPVHLGLHRHAQGRAADPRHVRGRDRRQEGLRAEPADPDRVAAVAWNGCPGATSRRATSASTA